MNPAIQKVNRNDLYDDIKLRIEKSDESEIELSSAELARDYNVSPATVDHHLRKLVQEGLLVISDRKGKHNRKIYRLPSNLIEEKKTHTYAPIDDQVIFEKLMQAKNQALSIGASKAEVEEKEEDSDFTETEINNEVVQSQNDSNLPDTYIQEEQKEINLDESKNIGFVTEMELRQKSLDDQVRDFQARNHVTSANLMLQKNDREILSVAVESLNQFSMFFKDLTEQLSTLEDKKFIQALIEERNQNLETIKELQSQVSAQAQTINDMKNRMGGKTDRIERAQFMVQRILHTLDNYVEQPSHTIYLERSEFRKNMNKEIMDLFRFATFAEKESKE